MRRTLSAVSVLLWIFPLLAQAQRTPQLNPGDRVRVTSAACAPETWDLKLASLTPDTLWVVSEDQPKGCPVAQVEILEVFRPTSVRKTSVIGLAAGLAGGVLVTAVIDSQMGRVPYTNRRWVDATDYLTGGLVGSAVGIVTGMSIGRRQRLGVWEEIPLPPVEPSPFLTRGNRHHLGFSIPLRM